MRETWESECGRAVMVNDDARSFLPSIASNSVDMIWTDPPFGHGNMDGDLQAARVRDGVKGARVKAAKPIANDAGLEFDAVLQAFLDESARVLNRDFCCCCCCCMAGGGPTPTFARVSQWIDERLAFFQAVVWDKSARGNGMGWRYRRNYEFVMVAHRKGGKLLWANDDLAVPNVVRHMPVIDRTHPNEKPVEMVQDFIRWHTKPGQLVCDPFAGYATTAIACIRSGRKFIGCELDPQWFQLAVERIEAELNSQPLFASLQPSAEQQRLFGEVGG
jgi:DNA modification methylase